MKVIAVFFIIFFLFSCKNNEKESKIILNQNNSDNTVEIITNNTKISNIEHEFIDINNNTDIICYSDNIVSKNLSINDEYEVKNDLKKKSINSHLLNINPTIFPLDKTIYPQKLHGTDYNCYPIRHPYSSNTVPMRSDAGGDYIYDIENNTFTKLDHYSYTMFGSDGAQYVMLSSEWSLINDVGSLYLIDKNHQLLNENIIDYLFSEFKNTIFDDEYVLETIKQINENQISYNGLITRYGIHINHAVSDNNGDENIFSDYFSTNSFFYLLNRLNTYFNVNISFYNEYNEKKSHPLHAKIYNDGFFFYSPYKVVFFDLKKQQVFGYKFDKNLSELTMGYDNYWIHLSKDNKKFYISLYDNRMLKIYEYDLF
jgi:hypothetical protein